MRHGLVLLLLVTTLAGCSETASGADSGADQPDGADGADGGEADDADSTPLDAAPGDDGSAPADAEVVGEFPLAEIWHPSAGETRDVDSAIPMIGNATDPEDGDLGGDAMVWTSDREGEIGRGRMFDWTPRMVGAQTVTLTATDSDGNSDTASITLTIE